MRIEFSSAVEEKDLVCKLGRWCWRPDQPVPNMANLLANARVYTAPKYSALRQSLQAPRVTVRELTTGADNQVALKLMPTEGAEEVILLAYCGGAVPKTYDREAFRGGIHWCDRLGAPTYL